MRNLLLPLLAVCTFMTVKAQEDAVNCKDNPMFDRMPNMVINECSSNYDQLEFPVGTDKNEMKEGTKTTIQYGYLLEAATAPSFFQIVKNFDNAVTKTGGKRVYYNKDAGVATFLTKSAGKTVWIVVRDYSGMREGSYELTTLEIEGMKQDIRASDMLEALNKSGSIALQILFETGSSIIKTESQSIVEQISEMLQSDPALKVSIQGHTDNVGTPAANLKLSQERAEAVVATLLLKGVDQRRLSSKGWGQEKPIADNATEDGKTQNRRVEIVKF